MNKSIIKKFNDFIKEIDRQVKRYMDLNDNKLTYHLAKIQEDLWHNYKLVNGNSQGFHGISEYIIFSVFKIFIENLNKPDKFDSQYINPGLRYFKLTKANKSLSIYRSTSTRHYPLDFKTNRAIDIGIVRQENNRSKLVAAIEVKNYLDKKNTLDAIKILSQIKKSVSDKQAKYAIFSFNQIWVGDKQVKADCLSFQDDKNNYIITRKKEEDFEIIDLAKFLSLIKKQAML